MVASTHPHDPKTSIGEKTPAEVVQDSVMGTDREMGEDHPGAPAAWVFGTYPVVLLIAALLVFTFFIVRPSSDSNRGTNSINNNVTSPATPGSTSSGASNPSQSTSP